MRTNTMKIDEIYPYPLFEILQVSPLLEDDYLYENFVNNLEQSSGGWSINQSTAFRRGVKKHRNNSMVIQRVKDVLISIVSGNVRTHHEFPNSYDVRMLSGSMKGRLSARISGGSRSFIMIFDFNSGTKTINLYHLGTPQEAFGSQATG